MKRYDLVSKRVNGYASSKIEEHPQGAFVKYEEVKKTLADLKQFKTNKQTIGE